MSASTRIEWTRGDDGVAGATWNPVTGCTKVSEGCDNCYAETFAERWRGIPGHPFEQGFDVRLWPERLDLPLRWRKPKRIFLNSMSDLWHDAVDGELTGSQFRAQLTNLMQWRLEKTLGYKTTMVFKITNTGGSEIFDMIFATDHPVGEKIMKDVYSSAMRRQPALRKKAQLQRRQDREEERGLFGMFDLDEVAAPPTEKLAVHIQYEHEPPHPPFTTRV